MSLRTFQLLSILFSMAFVVLIPWAELMQYSTSLPGWLSLPLWHIFLHLELFQNLLIVAVWGKGIGGYWHFALFAMIAINLYIIWERIDGHGRTDRSSGETP